MPYKEKKKQNEYRRQRTVGRRQQYLEGKKCVACGGTHSLEIDHIDPGLKISHRMWDWSQERIDIELAKCQILCQSCHRQKTHIQNNTQAVHGSIGMYKKGCRCEKCKEANTERVKKWRAKSF